MKCAIKLNREGLTLIELLVGLIICGIVIAGIYRVFVVQGKAFSIQDQVVEAQQSNYQFYTHRSQTRSP